ncbi:hypothetical protein JRQ81_011743 [Phrynocephalus forsythii]|uniref:Uncharacterized protein n=1 Tax=Phrynocephalus forsythii TaxID=171643 RepID=A0A9Q0X6Z4_9SAUR|nr:hypothetical protein JRQ81_011743 [Phrynocephalus forsythii]
MFSQSYSEPPSRYPSPVREDMHSHSQLTADDIIQTLCKTEHEMWSSVSLPLGSLCKSKEVHEEPKLKTDSMVPTSLPGITPSLRIRPLQSPHELHVHAPSRVEDNIFSHLPLHSQQLPRSPWPMIPIGGIQMVQARPNSHPSLGCGSVMSLQTTNFATGGNSLHGTKQREGTQRPKTYKKPLPC